MKFSDTELAKLLGISHNKVVSIRKVLRITRYRRSIVDPKLIAMICELFANGYTIVKISKLIKKPENAVSDIITKHWFTKKRSYNTITYVIESKINYEK